MFINVSVAKKLFKRAYTTGLKVGRYRDFLYIGGPAWEMEMRYEEAPYKIKAAIVELCGRLPEKEEQFTATKEGLQMEVTNYETVEDRYMNAKTLLDVTPVVIDQKYAMFKLLQYREEKDFTLINTEMLDLIDIREIDTDKEGMPSGPCSESSYWRNPVYWHSELGTLCLCPAYSDRVIDKRILEALQEVDFGEE